MAQIRFEKDGKVYQVFTGITNALIYMTDEEKQELQTMPEGSCMMFLPKHTENEAELEGIKNRLNSPDQVQTLK